MLRPLLLATTVALASLSATAAPTTYAIDPTHTDVLFTWNHFGFSNPSAHLGNIEGSITYDPDAPTQSKVEVTIPLKAVATHVPKMDEYMLGRTAFDAADFPLATFKSTKVTKGAAPNRLEVTGDLTLRGVTRPVTLDVTLNRVGPHPMQKVPAIGFEARTLLKRADFGMSEYLPDVGNDVRVHITVEALAGNTGK